MDTESDRKSEGKNDEANKFFKYDGDHMFSVVIQFSFDFKSFVYLTCLFEILHNNNFMFNYSRKKNYQKNSNQNSCAT